MPKVAIMNTLPGTFGFIKYGTDAYGNQTLIKQFVKTLHEMYPDEYSNELTDYLLIEASKTYISPDKNKERTQWELMSIRCIDGLNTHLSGIRLVLCFGYDAFHTLEYSMYKGKVLKGERMLNTGVLNSYYKSNLNTQQERTQDRLEQFIYKLKPIQL